MSFGFSVGDFLAVAQLAHKIRRSFVGAPKQLADISKEVRNLSIILQDADIAVAEGKLTDERRADLSDIIDNCRDILHDLDKALDKYRVIKTKPRNLVAKAKRTWKRLEWEPRDIRELRDRIISNVGQLGLVLEEISRQAIRSIKVDVERLNLRQDYQEQLDILSWLAPHEHISQQDDCMRKRQAGTGQWLLDSSEFQEWQKSNSDTLYCPGMPGAGKTILTAVVIDHLLTKFSSDEEIGLAYIYCHFRRKEQQTMETMLSSLIKQLGRGQHSFPPVRELQRRHQNTRPSADDLKTTLLSVISTYSQVFLVVDALDECQPDSRTRFLKEIFSLQAQFSINIFATSRFIPDIRAAFKGKRELEIKAQEEDIRQYLEGHMSDLPSFVHRNPDLQEEIMERICESANGMFLLSKLQLDSLIGLRSTRAVREALALLETGLNAVDKAYKGAMERIGGQAQGRAELAMHALLWITFAQRPLTTLELQHALSVRPGDTELDKENFPDIDDIVSACAGLVEVDEESNVIRLVHFTAQEYFQRTHNHWFPDAQSEITTTCVTYLAFDVFENGSCKAYCDLRERLRDYPFYEYAARYWGTHARVASHQCNRVVRFLESKGKVNAVVQCLALKLKSLIGLNINPRMDRLYVGNWIWHARYLIGFSGFHKTVEIFVNNEPVDIHLIDIRSYASYPLSGAELAHYARMIESALEKGSHGESSVDTGTILELFLKAEKKIAAQYELVKAGTPKVSMNRIMVRWN